MLNLTPENDSQVNHYQHHQNVQLITPPSSAKQSNISSEKSHKADIVNKYITEASVFILSFWKNPQQNSLFNTQTNLINQKDYERFTREVLKRSRCSLLGLQVAMYYLFKLQKNIKQRFISNDKSLMCPKRTFLICLILSFKFNYDSNYSFKSWSKISGLSIGEIKTLEFNILQSLDYDLNCNVETFEKWSLLLNQALEKIEKLIEIRNSNTTSLKRTCTSIEEENNNIKRVKIQTV